MIQPLLLVLKCLCAIYLEYSVEFVDDHPPSRWFSLPAVECWNVLTRLQTEREPLCGFVQRSTETVSCNKAACSHQAATGSGESREGALQRSHIIFSWRRLESDVRCITKRVGSSLQIKAPTQSEVSTFQIFCLHLFSICPRWTCCL